MCTPAGNCGVCVYGVMTDCDKSALNKLFRGCANRFRMMLGKWAVENCMFVCRFFVGDKTVNV